MKFSRRASHGKWSGSEIRIDGEDFPIMTGSDVTAVIDAPASQDSRVARRRAAPGAPIEGRPT
jgi:hypothetical protein